MKSSSFEEGQAIPFITYTENQGFILGKQAEDFLNSLSATKLGIVSVVGKYRTGKSFFINRVLLDKKNCAFSVGPTINPCTKGLWIWNKLIKCENSEFPDMPTIVIDTEGFGGVDENSNHDTRILLFSLLLSSFFIYNSIGSIDEMALQNLSMIINLAKEIQIKAKTTENENEDIAQYFPTFLWVIRDFVLRLVDLNGNPISSKEYLENSLAPQKGVSDNVESKNRIRRLFKHFFKERDCFTMVRPLENEGHLQKLDSMNDEELRPEFVEQIKQIKKRIFKKIKPKMVNGKFLNGSMLIEITKAYLMAVNSGKVPNIENAWNYVCKQESEKAMRDILDVTEKKLFEQNLRAPLNKEELRKLKCQLKQELITNFQKKSVGNEQEIKNLHSELLHYFQEKFSAFKRSNNENWNKTLWEWISTESLIKKKLDNNEYATYIEFKYDYEQFHQQYLQNAPDGITKNQIWIEFSAQLMNTACEILLKNQEREYEIKEKRLMKKVEMLEQDNTTRKQDYETEMRNLLNMIKDLEREKAICRAQEQNLQQKIEDMRIEKDRMQKNFEELTIIKRENENKIANESKEKIIQLENKLDSTKNENIHLCTSFEKKIALLEQELFFSQKENENYNEKVKSFEKENKNYRDEQSKYLQALDELRQKCTDLEISKQQEIALLKIELEKKIYDLQNEAEKRKDNLKAQNDWIIEKANLENRVEFFRNQLEENKRLHNALLIALESGTYKVENESNTDLVETNKNLSMALDKMEMRCKCLEEKVEKSKTFRKIIKNASYMTCMHCNKTFTCHIFSTHFVQCSNANFNSHSKFPNLGNLNNCPTLANDTNPGITSTTNLYIAINQTMVKDGPDSKPYTEYIIQVGYNNETKRTVYRKYKEFYELHHALNDMFPSLQFPESAFTLITGSAYTTTTTMTMTNTKKPVVIEERRRALQQYLRDLAKIEMIKESEPFQKFLELDQIGIGTLHNSDKTSRFENDTISYLNNIADERIQDQDQIKNLIQINENDPTYRDDLLSKSLKLNIDPRMISQSPYSLIKKWIDNANSKENENPKLQNNHITMMINDPKPHEKSFIDDTTINNTNEPRSTFGFSTFGRNITSKYANPNAITNGNTNSTNTNTTTKTPQKLSDNSISNIKKSNILDISSSQIQMMHSPSSNMLLNTKSLTNQKSVASINKNKLENHLSYLSEVKNYIQNETKYTKNINMPTSNATPKGNNTKQMKFERPSKSPNRRI